MKIKEIPKKDYFFFSVILILYCVAFLSLFNEGLIFCADTVGYLNYYSSQPPLYPLLILLCKLVGGPGYEVVLLTVQICIGLIGITIFSVFLHKQFSVNKWIVILLSFVLFEPYLFWASVGNRMATESLAYPLFLVTMKFLLEGLKNQSTRKFVLSFIFGSLLILTRTQFLFLYPLMVIIIFYLWFFTTTGKKRIIRIGIIFIAFLIGTFLFEKSYHFIRSGSFFKPASGTQLAANLMYVSTLQDSTLFSDKAEKEIFVKTMTDATHQRLIKSSSNSGSNAHYMNYNGNLVVLLRETFQKRYDPLTVADSIAMSKEYFYKYLKNDYLINIESEITKSISKKLMIHNWREYAQLILKSIAYELGYPILLIWKVVIGISLMILFIIGNRSYELTVLLMAILCHLLNLVLVASMLHILPRFAFYSNVLLAVLFASVLFSFLDRKSFPLDLRK